MAYYNNKKIFVKSYRTANLKMFMINCNVTFLSCVYFFFYSDK